MAKSNRDRIGAAVETHSETPSAWTADSILGFLKEHSAELRAMGVVRIGLFGSYARGEQHPDSDVDFLLTLDHWTWKRWCKVWTFLEDSFRLKVDLVPEDDLRPELRPYVLREVRYAQIA
ncbi:MAG: nucleotidyltransferase family protein [Anaerolineae bacterium]